MEVHIRCSWYGNEGCESLCKRLILLIVCMLLDDTKGYATDAPFSEPFPSNFNST